MGRWRRQLADWTELPKTLVSDVPFITLTGNMQLVVENHRGLRCCSPQRMVVASAHGLLTILGEGLLVEILTRDELVVKGEIHQVMLSS